MSGTMEMAIMNQRGRCIAGFLVCGCAAAALAMGVSGLAAEEGNLRLRDLHCEFHRDPIGIDAARPRLNWVLE